MRNRRTILVGSVLAGLLVAFAIAFLLGAFTDSVETPAPIAGNKVPTITQPPVTRLAVAGDTGTGDAAENATAQQMLKQSRTGAPYDALILLGDLVYEDGDASHVDQTVSEPFASLLNHGTTLVPVLGNHDYRSNEQNQIMTALGRDETWYVERIGSVRIIVLDTEQVDNPRQTQWLRKMLAAPQPPNTWTIAAMHKPAYSAGQHGSDKAVQSQWAPLFAKRHLPLVLAGHDHDYQRSKPINGVTYVVSGAGAKLRATGHADFTAVSSSTLHYLDLLIYKNRILVRAIDQSGKLVDSFTIAR